MSKMLVVIWGKRTLTQPIFILQISGCSNSNTTGTKKYESKNYYGYGKTTTRYDTLIVEQLPCYSK